MLVPREFPRGLEVDTATGLTLDEARDLLIAAGMNPRDWWLDGRLFRIAKEVKILNRRNGIVAQV